jgi:PHS family inorganic phosphate transporter-like MFS transporter
MAPGGSRLKAFSAALGNFSVQYNFGCLSMAVAMMTTYQGTQVSAGSGLVSDFPEPAWAKLALVGAVFGGSFVGMIIMGYVGDILGRRVGMMTTLLFVVLGAVLSAAASTGSANDVYTTICGCRFLLGFGVGGIYPMAAATAAESGSEEEEEEAVDASGRIVYDHAKALEVTKAFFWQTPGSLAPYIVALALTLVPSGPDSTSLQFRLLLGLGAVPALGTLVASYLSSSDAPQQQAGGKVVAAKVDPWTVIREEPRHLAALMGTGGCWFLYDVSFYGTSIFTPQILASIFGSSESLTTLAWQSFVVGSMGLPGIISAIALMRPSPKEGEEKWAYASCLPPAIDRAMSGWTARDLNVYGFGLMTVCFAAMGLAYAMDAAPTVKFAIFCIIQFSLNWGPNPGTYVQPTQSFPRSIRTTMHGLSAASGKAGAVVGTFMYGPLKDAAGFAAVMWVQTALSILGALASYFLLPAAPAVEEAPAGGKAKASGLALDEDNDSDKPLLDA